MQATARFYGTGRRKCSVARVWIQAGDGKIQVNDRPVDDFFPRPPLKMILETPFKVAGLEGKCDVVATVSGGGMTGQAGAIRLGISRALLAMDQALRTTVKKAGLLTRDPRVKERRKYGQKGARARFQFSKR
jgi:small subunit ribosomal protein S9